MQSAREPTLYIIGTPIGNLEDLSPRAKRTISELNHLIVEDTRETRKLLDLCGIDAAGKRLYSYASHNMKEATQSALELLHQGQDLGLMTDRGTPCISDPGSLLVERALGAGFRVVPIPGASCVTSALSISGMATFGFTFLGFAPTQESKLKEMMSAVLASPIPVCILESPNRIRKTLTFLKSSAPSVEILIARELTKQFETVLRTPLADLAVESIPELGEFTLVLHSPPKENSEDGEALDDLIRWRLLSDREWAKDAARKTGLAGRDAYNALQRAKDSRNSKKNR